MAGLGPGESGVNGWLGRQLAVAEVGRYCCKSPGAPPYRIFVLSSQEPGSKLRPVSGWECSCTPGRSSVGAFHFSPTVARVAGRSFSTESAGNSLSAFGLRPANADTLL